MSITNYCLFMKVFIINLHRQTATFNFSDHCMVNFVKPHLLGTRREFSNRFVNPIVNGQHKDSTAYDTKVMKRRAHVLHEMLAGFVQVVPTFN